jgi:YD repeat-containing protein
MVGAQRLLDAANGNATVATASYGVAGEMLGLSYFGYNETRSYNSLLQMTHQTVSGMMDMQYLYAAGSNNGRITQAIDGVAGETVNYTYDALNRLSGATAGTWGQGFSYDGFGNLTGKTATLGSVPTLSVSFDAATNRMTGQSYDANGNVMMLPGDTYDVENRVITNGVGSYGYDHAGKRVVKSMPDGSKELYFYGASGQKLATFATYYVCGTTCVLNATTSYNVYFGGKLVKSKGVVVVTDRLGSVRANSNGETMRYYPYGEERTTTADNREKFGT